VDLNGHKANRRWDRGKWTGKLTGLKIVFWPQDNMYPHPNVHDTTIALLGVRARNNDVTPAELPWAHKAVYLTQYRPNIPHRIPGELAMRPERGSHEGADGIPERFRTWTTHRELTPLVAILTGSEPDADLQTAARAAQTYLQQAGGVRLPINPEGMAPGPNTANAVLLGRAACLASGLVTPKELEYVGPEGFVLRAHNGRAAIAGQTATGTLYGLARYLEDHGARFFAPALSEAPPELKDGLLHEVIDFDRPYFVRRPISGSWRLRCPTREKRLEAGVNDNPDDAMALARRIKTVAKAKGEITPEMVRAAEASPLNRYVAAKLLWDPFLDASRLIEDYTKRAARTTRGSR
jgi:hypothetical protein